MFYKRQHFFKSTDWPKSTLFHSVTSSFGFHTQGVVLKDLPLVTFLEPLRDSIEPHGEPMTSIMCMTGFEDIFLSLIATISEFLNKFLVSLQL